MNTYLYDAGMHYKHNKRTIKKRFATLHRYLLEKGLVTGKATVCYYENS